MERMKKIFIAAVAAISVAGALSSCSKDYTVYDGKAYVMFPDTLFVCPAAESGEPFTLQVASLNSCDYDRTYAVEVDKSSDAVYNWHYTIKNQTVVIPAGQLTADVEILPVYGNLPEDASPVLKLNLVSQYGDEFSVEGSSTKVEFRKIKTFDINDYVGHCRLTSSFLIQYQGIVSRYFTTSIVEGEENTILLEDFMSDGYDVKARFDLSNPLEPRLNLVDGDNGQIIGDSRSIFLMPHGDNMIRAINAPGYPNVLSPWKRSANVYTLLGINGAGTIGVFQNILTWVEDYEVE